jgi:hypothetical protein
MTQDFFAAFGHDAVGTIGTPTTITSGDLDGILEKHTVQQMKEIDALRVENADLKARLEALERRVGREFATTTPLRGLTRRLVGSPMIACFAQLKARRGGFAVDLLWKLFHNTPSNWRVFR